MRSLCFGSALVLLLAGCNAPPPPSPNNAVSSIDTTPSPAPKQEDRWEITTKTNELDGKKKITVSDSDVIVRCGTRFEGYVRPTLNDLGGRLETQDGYGQYVRFRLDGGPLRRERWSISDTFDSLFIPTRTLRQVVDAKKLVLEYHPEYITETTETFDLEGLKEAYHKAGCK